MTVATSETDGFKRYLRSAKLHNINGKVLAKAWCEAVVQRTPEPVRPDQVTGLNPRVPQDGEVNFGRRFQIVSFRWLHADEV